MLITQSTEAAPAMLKAARTPQTSAARMSHLRGKHGSAAASCHSLRYRLPVSFDLLSLRERFDDAVKVWQHQIEEATGEAGRTPMLWIESVPGVAGSEIAERRRNSEMMRPVEILDGAPCRAMLLQYQDQTSDFILVAHRSVLDRPSLAWIAGTALGEDCPLPASTPCPDSNSTNCESDMEQIYSGNYSSHADWGMSSEKDESRIGILHQHVELSEKIEPASLLAAAGFVLSRYSGQPAPVVAVLADDPARPEEALGAYEGVALSPPGYDGALSARQLIENAAHRLARPACWYTAAAAGDLSAKCENRGEVLLGVFCARENSRASLPSEYLPCLAPPFPMTITCAPSREGYRLTCLFRVMDFDRSVAAQFMNTIVQVHREMRHNPESIMSRMNISDEAEQRRLASLRRPRRELGAPDERIEDIFARKAMQNPQGLALSCGEDRRTYRELHERSGRMARALRDCGVRAGDRVGVCIERSLELVEVLLAILKAGAAYVPMDPAYPADRLAFTMQDAQIALVVASPKNFQAGGNVRVLEVQELLRMAQRCPEAPINEGSSSDAAYVIYTSGSTGRPKGVVIPHGNVLSLLAATAEDFGLSSQDTWTLFHSSAFDFSVWEIWGCLMTGGHLVVVPYWITRNPEEFVELLAKERVTVLNQTPSAFAQLLEVDRTRPAPSSLRLVIFGGEPLDARMLLPWFDRHPEFECRMVNMFGITETTVHVTLETITREHALSGSKSVGFAMPGWYYHVMDSEGRPLPPGVAGEIYVGGAGVAQYYLNRPELTAQRFVPDPCTGERIYRSGDKGRLRPDGRLEHLGRLDSQVKIRGFRIELDEIRSVLQEAPGVTTAAVIVHQDDPADPATARLCAYVVLNGSNLADVRAYIGRMLPEYMVPSVVMEMPALPLTQNGKLDTKRLPSPSKHALRHHEQQSARKPESIGDKLTSALLHIWETVLGVPVGLDDNFFDLGGNSLFAMRIATAMRTQGLPLLPVRELYVHQTIRRLGASLKS
jgi:amino acid adenylation domain-containing protein